MDTITIDYLEHYQVPICEVLEVLERTNFMTDENLFGAKPPECPEQVENCGQCQIYPCRLADGPAVNSERPPIDQAVIERLDDICQGGDK